MTPLLRTFLVSHSIVILMFFVSRWHMSTRCNLLAASRLARGEACRLLRIDARTPARAALGEILASGLGLRRFESGHFECSRWVYS